MYNLRVALDHTYFVGRATWGFSLWVHNAYIARAVAGSEGKLWEIVFKDEATGAENALKEYATKETAERVAARANRWLESRPARVQPYGGPGGGHHVPAKSAFRGALGYHENRALAIANDELARLGVDHQAVSLAQRRLYVEFARTGENLTWEAMERIETQALIDGGMKSRQASSTVKMMIQALKDDGVSGPTRIPWGD